MHAEINTTALFKRLDSRPELQAKALELRHTVGAYLRGVDVTFSHFTSHAIDHSDEIVRQLSRMLFSNPEDQESISVDLNSAETYLLLISIYLHDVGMVVTEREKYAILNSAEWKAFREDDTSEDDLSKLELGLGVSGGTDQALFVQALEQKLLLASFFRARHANRASGAINGALRVQEDFLFNDPSAASTVSAICVGHGVARSELGSSGNYPTRRDLFDDAVNVRLLAILVRIGDLLDMRSERACPLMYSVVSPLPPSSEAHWSQYRRILSRVTSPARIELIAECETANEHRLLLDWCTWLAEEVAAAPGLLAGGQRHSGWNVPRASVGGPPATIQIKRAPNARYRAEDWKFQFDENEIVVRLVRDVHRGRFGFMQELLQNALDTSRARALLGADPGVTRPEDLSAETRSKYPVSVDLTVENDQVTTVSVGDFGLGMTSDIVRNYFLQIGRSWYRSSDFSRLFSFNPTSRFGIGFLSVFAVSDDVRVTTRWHESEANQALSMTLPGPKNHLLFEDSDRTEPGTDVTVHLRKPYPLDALIDFLQTTCVANEFDVIVTMGPEAGVKELRLPLPATDPSKFMLNVGTFTEPKTLKLHEVCSLTDGVSGGLSFFKIVAESGVEDWSLPETDIENLIRSRNPLAEIPELDPAWTAINGLRPETGRTWFPHAKTATWHFDVRTASAAGEAGLDRGHQSAQLPWNKGELGTALNSHLAATPNKFPYVAHLQERFRALDPDWASSVPVFMTLDGSPLSMANTERGGVLIAMAADINVWTDKPVAKKSKHELLEALQTYAHDQGEKRPIVLSGDLGFMTYSNLQRLSGRVVGDIVEIQGNLILLEVGAYAPTLERENKVWLDGHASSELVRFTDAMSIALVNRTHPLSAEILSISDVNKSARERLLKALRSPLYDDELGRELEAVGTALDNERLLAYAEAVKRESDSTQTYRVLATSQIFRLPRL